MIVMAAPASCIRNGRPVRSTHLLSTTPGLSGRVELLRDARTGVKRRRAYAYARAVQRSAARPQVAGQ